MKGGTGKGMNQGSRLSLILTTDKRVNGVEWLWQGWPTLSHSLYPSFGNLALTVDFGDISCARMPPRIGELLGRHRRIPWLVRWPENMAFIELVGAAIT